MMTTPETPLAAPKRASAMPAASASLSTSTSLPVPTAAVKVLSASVPTQVGSTLAADCAMPCLITAGNVAPISPVQPASRDQLRRRPRRPLSGVAGWGVGMRSAFGEQRAGVHVDDGALDAGTADVDAERLIRSVIRTSWTAPRSSRAAGRPPVGSDPSTAREQSSRCALRAAPRAAARMHRDGRMNGCANPIRRQPPNSRRWRWSSPPERPRWCAPERAATVPGRREEQRHRPGDRGRPGQRAVAGRHDRAAPPGRPGARRGGRRAAARRRRRPGPLGDRPDRRHRQLRPRHPAVRGVGRGRGRRHRGRRRGDQPRQRRDRSTPAAAAAPSCARRDARRSG